MDISERADGKVVFLGVDPDSGSFPSWAQDEEGNDLEFDWETCVMPFVAEGEVLVTMEAGAEKLRYIVGVAAAFVRVGTEVMSTALSLNDIYAQAVDEFGAAVALKDIDPCEY